MGPLHPSSFTGIMLKKKAEKMNTCEEFWRLCWETNSRIIVMLCAISPGFQVHLNLNPYTRQFYYNIFIYVLQTTHNIPFCILFETQGCSQYFPQSTGAEFRIGKFRITDVETITSNDDYVEKEFLLEQPATPDSSSSPPEGSISM